MLKLGDLKLNKPFMQASLSGYSDRPMRELALKHGAPLTFAGVMLSTLIHHPKVLRHPNFAVADHEHPIGAQILGNDPEIMAAAAKGLLGIGYDLIDLNFACPAPKVLRRERGGYMLNDPELILSIFRQVRQAVQKPVMMKLRIGVDKSSESLEKFWRVVEGACAEGIDGLIIHGRTVKQKYRGSADWSVIAEVKRRFPETTIIGSGDIFTAETVIDRLKTTGIDGISVARGAVGNPWIFSDVETLLEGKPRPAAPSVAEQGQTILWHFLRVLEHHQRRKGIAYFRKFSARYAKHHPEPKRVKLALVLADDEQQIVSAIKECYGIN